ncbi:hypothetical protein GR198_05760 [Rhizobium leguminosarum]|jgi:hypothetical protein|uniref:hypothetical protein n=1 Tax=Rhizobium leguminosarum TaxID=384 RepID=UPI0013C062F2|nr:hypothetical protein [Rhizobium leguminosarum]NEH55252.1 hypothetical protein [Rhizobium leguminosarum]
MIYTHGVFNYAGQKMYPDWPDFAAHTTPREQTYLRNKEIGGDSGRKGLIFEGRYAAFRLVELAAALLNGDLEAARVHLKIQVRSFVDDFAIIFDDQIEWYEIKSGKVYWGKVPDAEVETGVVERKERTVADNFRSQASVDQSIGYPSTLTLVVADGELRDKLRNERRHHDLPGVEVHWIPDSHSPSEIWEIEPEFEEWLRALSPLTESEEDFEVVYDAFQGAIAKLKPGVALNLLELGKLAAKRYHGVLSIGRKGRLNPETWGILELFKADVQFAVSGTTLHYQWKGDHGIVPAEIGTEAGRRFEAAVKAMPNYDVQTLIELLWRFKW